jgi:hypothetical protein
MRNKLRWRIIRIRGNRAWFLGRPDHRAHSNSGSLGRRASASHEWRPARHTPLRAIRSYRVNGDAQFRLIQLTADHVRKLNGVFLYFGHHPRA